MPVEIEIVNQSVHLNVEPELFVTESLMPQFVYVRLTLGLVQIHIVPAFQLDAKQKTNVRVRRLAKMDAAKIHALEMFAYRPLLVVLSFTKHTVSAHLGFHRVATAFAEELV